MALQDRDLPFGVAPENTRPLQILSCVVAGISLTCIVVWMIACYQLLADPAHGGRNLDIDFSVFWSAARMGLEGDWLGPFDTAKLSEARLIPLGREAYEMLWFYPPTYHLLIAPVGYLPFFWSWLVFAAITWISLALAIRVPASGTPAAVPLVMFSPAALFLILLGQNSLLIAALLVGTIEALRRERIWIAGTLIAAMTIKPQLGLAIPIALLAGGYWRVILAASLSAILLVALSSAILGWEYWETFFFAVRDGGDLMRQSDLIRLMVSGFGNAVALGIRQETAMALQLILSLGTAGALAWLWRSRIVGFDLKAAALCASVLLMTPYAVHYELIFAVLAAFYLARDGAARHVGGRYLVVMLWLAPAIGYAMLPWPGFVFTAPLMLGALLYTMARARGRAVMPAAYGTAECPTPNASR